MACTARTNGFTFCYQGVEYNFPAVPTSGGPWSPSVEIVDGVPVLDWVNDSGQLASALARKRPPKKKKTRRKKS